MEGKAISMMVISTLWNTMLSLQRAGRILFHMAKYNVKYVNMMYTYESRLLGKLKMKQAYLFGWWYCRYIFLIILVSIIFI